MTDKLRHLWLMAVAILALASCSQDDVGEGGSPTDDTPVIFSATGITPLGTTRATVDGTWEGKEKVTVKVNGVEKTYVVKPSADKKSATLEADTDVEPFKWSEVEGKAVEAYTTDNVLDDQSTPENYQASDWLHASVNNMTRTSELDFNHQVARVVIKVSNGNIKNDEVKLVVGSRTITPYRDEDNKQYLAIVESGSISLSVKIKHDGKDYIYTYTGSESLIGGNSYAINVTIFNPMHIYDEATLKAWAEAVKNDPNHAISAIVDKDFSMTTPAEGESNWEPISTFKGTFDGNGHTISGIVVNESFSVGFICDNSGTVKNLTLNDTKITGNEYVGAVAGKNNGTIENCHVTGGSELMSSASYAGGVAGKNSGTIENCHVTGASVITGSGSYVGGVAGSNHSKILACHVAKDCTVSGGTQVGGIAGFSVTGGQIIGCYALCSLEGEDNIGGICGSSVGTSITACYSKCTYSSGTDIGGIVGTARSNATFSECYWEGDTKCTKGVGNAMTNPDGVIKVGAAGVIWNDVYIHMNKKLEGTGYKYVENDNATTSAAEPFMLVKTQQ